jgi:hypothetical protein
MPAQSELAGVTENVPRDRPAALFEGFEPDAKTGAKIARPEKAVLARAHRRNEEPRRRPLEPVLS